MICLFTQAQEIEPLLKINKDDPEVWQSHTFTIKSGNTGSYFLINQDGYMFVKRTAYVSFVKYRTWTIIIRVTDDGIMKRKDGWFLEEKQYMDKRLKITLSNTEPPEIVELL